MSDNILIDVSTTIENVNVEVVEASAPSISIDQTYYTGPTFWGTVLGTLSTQTDLWRYLSAETFSPSQLTAFLNSNAISLCSINVNGTILSAGTDLFDIFLTSKTDSQTLSYTPSSYLLSISNGNTVNLSSINSLFGSVSGKYESVYSNVQSNSANWNTAYNVSTAYRSASSSFATNTTLNSVSSLLTPLTLANILTSQLVTNTAFTNYRTDVAASTATLLPITIYKDASGNWQGTFTTVQSNSSNWNNAYNIGVVYSQVSGLYVTATTLSLISSLLTPLTLTNILTSQLVTNINFDNFQTSIGAATATLLPTSVFQNASSNWQGTFTTVQSNSSNWNNAYNIATVYQSNSSSYATTNYVNSNFFPLSGGVISGPTRINNNLTVFGNLTATGTTTFANTIFSVTSSLSVVHIGSGPALYVGNNGNGDIASFYDIDQNIEVLHVGGINSSFPNVGIKVSSPNKDFTVNGEISANSTIYDRTGNSNQWNEAYTNLISNSAAYLSSVDLSFLSVSGNWNQAYNIATAYQSVSSSFATNSTVNSVSALLTPLTLTNTLTSQLVTNTDFGNYQTSVGLATATLLPTSVYQSTSGNWQSTFTAVQTNSANWNQAYNVATAYQSVSSSFATNTALNAASSVLTPLTLTNTLTGQLVTNTAFNNFQTSVASSTATLLPITTYQNASGSFATISFSDSKYLPLSGGTITGNLSVLGDVTYLDTTVAVVSTMFIDTNSAETALRITQRGSGDVIRVEDSANPDSTPFIVKSDGLVGIGTDSPNTNLTVVGNISATGNLNVTGQILSGGINISQLLSSTGGGGGGDPAVNTVVYTNSATWINTSTVVQNNSASWFEPVRRFDYVTVANVDISYSGTAPFGTIDTNPIWKLIRLTYANNGTISNQASSINSWTGRLTATYV